MFPLETIRMDKTAPLCEAGSEYNQSVMSVLVSLTLHHPFLTPGRINNHMNVRSTLLQKHSSHHFEVIEPQKHD